MPDLKRSRASSGSPLRPPPRMQASAPRRAHSQAFEEDEVGGAGNRMRLVPPGAELVGRLATASQEERCRRDAGGSRTVTWKAPACPIPATYPSLKR